MSTLTLGAQRMPAPARNENVPLNIMGVKWVPILRSASLRLSLGPNYTQVLFASS